MFNKCLSKSASALLNSALSKKQDNTLDQEVSANLIVNKNSDQQSSFNKKNEEFYEDGSHLPTIKKKKKVEREIDSHNNYSSNWRCFKNTDFNPNYKVESSLNVNVNLVTYPNYLKNCNNNDDKVSLNNNGSINLSNSTAHYSKNIQKVFSDSGYPSTNISNFANININNTLPQILINPLNKINNQNFLNTIDYIKNDENEKRTDLNRNFSHLNKIKEKKYEEKFNCFSNIQKTNSQKEFPFETVVNLFFFYKLFYFF